MNEHAEELILTAHHEAGHAVMMWFLRSDFLIGEISLQPDDESDARVAFAESMPHLHLIQALISEGTASSANEANSRAMSCAMNCLAGEIAEARFEHLLTGDTFDPREWWQSVCVGFYLQAPSLVELAQNTAWGTDFGSLLQIAYVVSIGATAHRIEEKIYAFCLKAARWTTEVLQTPLIQNAHTLLVKELLDATDGILDGQTARTVMDRANRGRKPTMITNQKWKLRFAGFPRMTEN